MNSCTKDMQFPVIIDKMSELKVDKGFTFKTEKPVTILVNMLDNNDGPVKGMRVDVYTAHPDSGGKRLVSGITDSKGIFECEYSIPAYMEQLMIGTDAIGFVNMQTIKIESGMVYCKLGGKADKKFKSGGGAFFKSTNSVFVPLGTYNSSGVPNYLEPQNDIIDASMIQDINATLPERIALPTSHPQYFDAGNVQNLLLDEACNVWVTFVHEGAGYRNVLGFYTYTQGDVPATVSDIDSIHIVFPNASFQGSGGGLVAGNKVYIGQYPPGTSIGWVLISDGFRNGTITNGNWIFYSDKNLNPEANASIKQHFILCNDIGRGKFLLGVEDIKRDQSSDNDFNDAVFYVSADPIQAVDVSHVPLPNYTATDSDQDGISDNFDDYPNDAGKAFNNYYPSEGSTGSLAFEDLWPSVGDYDFNDIVIDYHVNQVTNGQNKVVGIQAKYILRAIGAGYESGFGFQLPVSPNVISSFSGYELSENIITLAANGTEAAQSKATFILFDNAYHILPHISGSGVNTTVGSPYRTPDTLSVSIAFTSPQALSAIGTPPYNPFIFVNGDRSKEVHLINQPPTSLADMTLFGTGSDDSDPASGRYYVTRNNLPWCLNTVDKFDYPAEKIPILNGYTKFVPWSVSSGNEYYDWFLNISGYRNAQQLYH
ncbi:MAG: LruC domain-containing protein [Bacteroidales bacterium]|nr:LruC domain-containing protein [Bacteroidales bacterium]